MVSATAQTSTEVQLTAPLIRDFPTMGATFKAYNGLGIPIRNLARDDVYLLEDGNDVALTGLNEVYAGVHYILVINPGREMDIRNAAGVSPYEMIIDAIHQWAETIPDNEKNRYTLVTEAGMRSREISNLQAWLADIDSLEIDFRKSLPGYQGISKALELAANFEYPFGMDQQIIMLTPRMEAEDLAIYQEFAQRDFPNSVKVNIWLVTTESALLTDRARAMEALALKSRGNLFLFTGVEAMPDFASVFSPYGYYYELAYQTSVRQKGTHQLSVTIQVDEQMISSMPQEFNLDVQPPNPAFVSPPMEIVRSAPEGSTDPLAALMPVMQKINVLVEFPDGHPRALNAMRLYVDDVLTVEKTAPPFESLDWDVSAYTAAQTVLLRLEVEDLLGYTVTTVEMPVLITVNLPEKELIDLSKIPVLWWVIGGGVLAVAGAFVLVYFLVIKRKKTVKLQQRQIDQFDSQTVRIHYQSAEKPAPEAFAAQLVRVTPNNLPIKTDPILLKSDMITFGSDRALATQYLDEKSIDPLHARLQRTRDGLYILADLGSVAGTWINYAPIGREGVQLEHGDLVHIGRVGFRFLLEDADITRKPQVRNVRKEL